MDEEKLVRGEESCPTLDLSVYHGVLRKDKRRDEGGLKKGLQGGFAKASTNIFFKEFSKGGFKPFSRPP